MLYRTVEAVVERISGKKMGKIMSTIVQLLIFGGGYIGSLCLPDLFISTPSALFSGFILMLLLILDAKRGWRGRVMKTPFVFVDEYRGSLLLLTAVAILAVDFPVFPRRFAKTETFGHSIVTTPPLSTNSISIIDDQTQKKKKRWTWELDRLCLPMLLSLAQLVQSLRKHQLHLQQEHHQDQSQIRRRRRKEKEEEKWEEERR